VPFKFDFFNVSSINQSFADASSSNIIRLPLLMPTCVRGLSFLTGEGYRKEMKKETTLHHV
jgi:hypothetical protein